MITTIKGVTFLIVKQYYDDKRGTKSIINNMARGNQSKKGRFIQCGVSTSHCSSNHSIKRQAGHINTHLANTLLEGGWWHLFRAAEGTKSGSIPP